MVNKNRLTDEELVELIRRGNEEAQIVLFERYNAYCYRLAYEFKNSNSKSGITVEEFHNIAKYSLHLAIEKFSNDSTSFNYYWSIVAKHEILRYIQKNSYQNDAKEFFGVSLDTVLDNDIVLSDVVGDDDKEIGSDAFLKEVRKIINGNEADLTKDEHAIALLLLKGFTPKEISNKLGISVSRAYYLIKLVREKLYNIISTRYFK